MHLKDTYWWYRCMFVHLYHFSDKEWYCLAPFFTRLYSSHIMTLLRIWMLRFLTSCLSSAGRNPNIVTIGHPSYQHTWHCASGAIYHRTLTGLNMCWEAKLLSSYCHMLLLHIWKQTVRHFFHPCEQWFYSLSLSSQWWFSCAVLTMHNVVH